MGDQHKWMRLRQLATPAAVVLVLGASFAAFASVLQSRSKDPKRLKRRDYRQY